MKRTIYIPKGKECRHESLTGENLIVNGFLKVAGTITAKSISGTGVIHANTIKADSIVAHSINADYIVTDELAAKQVYAVSVIAVQSMLVSSYLEAGYVKTQKAIIAEADVEDMQAVEIERLSPKEHSVFGAVLISTAKAVWMELLFALKSLFVGLAAKSGNAGNNYGHSASAHKTKSGSHSRAASGFSGSISIDINDPDFLRFCEQYIKMKNGVTGVNDENGDPAVSELVRGHRYAAFEPDDEEQAA